jgi:hypothetical protein
MDDKVGWRVIRFEVKTMMGQVEAGGRWFAQRLRVEQMYPMKVTMGGSGLLCIGVPEAHGCPALVAICDETAAHGGASATNSMEGVLTVLESWWAGKVAVSRSNIIELDSLGQWDVVLPTWRGACIETVAFQAVKWVDCRAGSKEALLGVFGPMGAQVLHAMETMSFHG